MNTRNRLQVILESTLSIMRDKNIISQAGLKTITEVISKNIDYDNEG